VISGFDGGIDPMDMLSHPRFSRKNIEIKFFEEEHFCPKSRGSQLRFPLRTPSSAKHQRVT
jgi:hypothetical protein